MTTPSVAAGPPNDFTDLDVVINRLAEFETRYNHAADPAGPRHPREPLMAVSGQPTTAANTRMPDP